jgi:hypothetical protein
MSRTARVSRLPVLLVVIAAVVAALVLDRSPSASTTGGAPATANVDGASVPPADAVSASWFCAEGTSNEGGRADETVIIASLATGQIDATVTVMPADSHAPESRHVRVAPRSQERVPISSVLRTAEPGVVVEVVGGQAVVSHELRGNDDVAVEPCTRRAGTDWYFAAGTSVKGSQQFLVLFNPFGDDAIVDTTLYTDAGVQQPDDLQAMVVPRRSRVSIPLHDIDPRQERIAVHTHARAGRVVAERTLLFDGTAPDTGPTRQGLAVSLGAESPAGVWQLVSGTTEGGGEAAVSIANFAARETTVEVGVLLPEDQTVASQSVTIPGGGVVAVDVTQHVPVESAFAVTVTSRDAEGPTGPVVAELLAWWPPGTAHRGIATTLGSVHAARRWVIPLPAVDSAGSLTVLNPGSKPITAALLPARFIDRPSGATSEPERGVAPQHIATFQVVKVSDDGSGALVVTADRPMIVGFTIAGSAGAAASAGIPDPLYRR